MDLEVKVGYCKHSDTNSNAIPSGNTHISNLDHNCMDSTFPFSAINAWVVKGNSLN